MAGGITESERAQKVSLTLIAKRNLDPRLQRDTEEALRSSLLRLSTVRLDRERIASLSNLEYVREVHSLYLQQNLIKKIDNLDILKDLSSPSHPHLLEGGLKGIMQPSECRTVVLPRKRRSPSAKLSFLNLENWFLSLSGNLIVEVANIYSLQNLKFLDLSHNLIESINAGEFPPGLLILDLTGNACRLRSGYRQEVLRALPNLQELDKERVNDRSRPDFVTDHAQEAGSDSDTDDINPGLGSVSREMLRRSHFRRDRALREHQDRVEELEDTRDMLTPVSAGRDLCSPREMGQFNEPAQSLSSSNQQPHGTDPKSSNLCEDVKSQGHTLPETSQAPAPSEKVKIRPQSHNKSAKSQTSHNKASTKPTQAAGRGLRPTGGSMQSDLSAPSRSLQHVAPIIRKEPESAAPLAGANNGRRTVSAPSKNLKPRNLNVRSRAAVETRTAPCRARGKAQSDSRK